MVCFDTPSSRPTSAAVGPASICFSAPIISTSEYFLFDIPSPFRANGDPKPENETVGKLKAARWICFSGRERRRSHAEEGTQRGAGRLCLKADRRRQEGR